MRWSLVWCVSVVVAITASAQVGRGRASPIAPEVKLYDYVGGIVGVPIVVQQGSYRDTCNCPPFTNGIGSGIVAGALYELPAQEEQVFRFGISGGLGYRALVARYRQQEPLTFTSADSTERYSNVPVEFRQEATFRLVDAWLQPYAKVIPFRSEVLAIGVGANVGALISGTVTHTKALVQNTVRLPNGETLALSMPGGSTSTVVRSGEIEGLQRLQVAAVIRVESSIDVGSEWRVRPGLQVHLPLTQLSSSGMKVGMWMLTISLARRMEE